VNVFRTLKIALSISIIVFTVLGVSASFAILDRQKALEDAARYNMVWAVSQAIGEFYRFEGSVGAYGVPESGTDKDEVQLRFDILYNRLDIFRRGDVKEFTDAKPELGQTVEAFGRLLAEIDPLVQTIDRPGVVARILKLCQPFKAKLGQLAASANEYGGDQASADQHRLLQLHAIFSGIAAALVVCGIAFIILLFFQNRLLTTAYESLRAQIEERERAEEALRQSQKMEAIGRLTGGVAHDFNNLLTVVAGNLDLIDRLAEVAGEGGVPRDRLRRLVEAAQRGLGRGERLTRQLLVLSRQDPIEARIVDVNAMIADFAPLIQRAIGETIDLRLQLGEDKCFCKLDPTQFEAAMLNLAINARDAIEGAGTLTIATSPVGLPDDLTGLAVAPHILLSVADTGSGMSAEVQRRVFEPFYTTKPVGMGSGLGLAQVWAFATQSAGRIVVDSSPGKGTTFRLYLPLLPGGSDAVEHGRPVRAEEGGSEMILVVEDEDDVREVTAATLERLGYRTTVARDGREALAILGTSGDFDLLFTDYVMPNGLNGAQLARAALRLRPRLKVLVTSGYARQSGTADDAGVDDFPMIAKPYRSADLAARIRELLDRVPAERASRAAG
jgi:signal transduction histidine kinase/ActR/RegA family two-component response regulator